VRVILDTNVLLSAILKDSSTPGEVVRVVDNSHTLLCSAATLEEFRRTVLKPYFMRYIGSCRVRIEAALSAAEQIEIIETVSACRDPKDDKFLEVALNGRAGVIITGDRDLLVLHPWRGIKILSPAVYLDR